MREVVSGKSRLQPLSLFSSASFHKIPYEELQFQESFSQTSSHSHALLNDPYLTAPLGYFYLSQICPRMHCPTFSLILKVFIFSDSNRTDGPEEIKRPPETYFIKTGRSVIVQQLCDLYSKNDIIVMIGTAWTFQILLPINLQNHVMITDITDIFSFSL